MHPEATLISFYGSVEVSGDAACYDVRKVLSQQQHQQQDASNVWGYSALTPIGRPIMGCRMHLLGKNNTPVRPGEVGEVVISGKS